MAIQMRRGVYSKFDPDRMVAGEWAIVLSGAQDAANGQAAYVCFAPGQVKRVATVEDMATIIANAEPEVAESITTAASKFLTDTNEAVKLAESKRVAAENSRVAAESARESAESKRVAAENSRVDAESKRVAAESARAEADEKRETAQAKNNADQAQNNAAAKGLTYQIVADGGYKSNGSHNVPTATSGSTGVVYLTPNLSSESNNLYESWMWINGAWELMGEDKHVAPTTTDDVDSIVGGTSVTADRYLNSTGLSYLWTKLVAWATGKFAALKHSHSASDMTSGTLSADRLPTVPIAHGGTGATTAAAALTALGAASASDLATVRDSVSQASAYSLNNLTLGSAMKSGNVYCERLGMLVLLHFNAVVFATSYSEAENHDVVVCTGAPAPRTTFPVYMLSSTSSEVRVIVSSTGSVIIHWSSVTAGIEYNGLVAYIAA